MPTKSAGVGLEGNGFYSLATNTSSLSIASIAEATARPQSVVGMHFFNPVHRMPLVEVVRGAATDDDTVLSAASCTTNAIVPPLKVMNDTFGIVVTGVGDVDKDGYDDIVVHELDRVLLDHRVVAVDLDETFVVPAGAHRTPFQGGGAECARPVGIAHGDDPRSVPMIPAADPHVAPDVNQQAVAARLAQGLEGVAGGRGSDRCIVGLA